MDSLYFFLAAWAIPWLIASWMRLPRYMRYFQVEGYDRTGYLGWFWGQQSEQRLFRLVFALGLLYSLGACFLSITLLRSPIFGVVASLVLCVIAVCLSPSDRETKQQFVRTSRAIRLIVVAFVVEAIPLIVAAIIILFSVKAFDADESSPEATWIGAMFVLEEMVILSAGIGPICYLFVPFTLPLANLINWPIEKKILARKASQTGVNR